MAYQNPHDRDPVETIFVWSTVFTIFVALLLLAAMFLCDPWTIDG